MSFTGRESIDRAPAESIQLASRLTTRFSARGIDGPARFTVSSVGGVPVVGKTAVAVVVTPMTVARTSIDASRFEAGARVSFFGTGTRTSIEPASGVVGAGTVIVGGV